MALVWITETDASTGITTQRQVEMPVLSDDEAQTRGQIAARTAARQAIIDQLAANDLKALRALLEGDTARIAQHIQDQAVLRAQLA